MELIVASIPLESSFLVLAHDLVDDVFPVEKSWASEAELFICSLRSKLWYAEVTHAFSEHLSKA